MFIFFLMLWDFDFINVMFDVSLDKCLCLSDNNTVCSMISKIRSNC